MMRPARVVRSAVVLKTSTLLHFHKINADPAKVPTAVFPQTSPSARSQGPTKELIDVVDMTDLKGAWDFDLKRTDWPLLGAAGSSGISLFDGLGKTTRFEAGAEAARCL
jgi:hypothetical protein